MVPMTIPENKSSTFLSRGVDSRSKTQDFEKVLDKSAYTPILVIILLIAAFFLGSLTTKVQYLEKGQTTQAQQAAQPTTQAQAAQPQQAKQADLATIQALFTDKNIHFGDKNGKNLLVEIADPSCPYCSIAAGHNPELNKQAGPQFALPADGGTYVPPVPEMKKMVDEGKASFVWIYYPGHGNGEMGTKSMYCAHEKGKFWEVHDKLMTKEGYDLLNNQVKNDKTKSQALADFLASVFDPTDMKTCLDSGKYDARLQEDVATGTKLFTYFQNPGTPGFFINTTAFAGAYSWKDLLASIKN